MRSTAASDAELDAMFAARTSPRLTSYLDVPGEQFAGDPRGGAFTVDLRFWLTGDVALWMVGH